MMAQAGFLEEKRVRPGGAAAVILVHAAAIAGLMLAAGPEIIRRTIDPTRVVLIPVEPDPPPIPDPPPQAQVRPTQPTTIDVPPRINELPQTGPTTSEPPTQPPDLGSTSGREQTGEPAGETRPDPRPDPPRPLPVRVEAQMIGGDLQPPYPTAEQRLEHEGSVVIRVTIGTNGRVIGTQQVRATSSAFYEATERHARARWRFRPATLDGRPVESQKTLTVRFRLDG
jgi:protein TonB